MNSLNNAHRSVSECLKCNVKITFLLLFLFFIVYPSQSYAQSAYAVLNNTVLTFYYDGLKNDRVGEKFIMNTGTSFPEWMDNGGGTGSYNNNNITKVVFDEQFQYYRPTSCYYWFSGCNKLTEIVGLEYLNTSDVTNMSHMFYYCDYLNSIDVSHFNTAKVTDMAYMFGFCSSVTSLDFSSFNTSNVTDMSYMFCYANRLSLADLTTFNTDKVTNMGYMFDNSGVSVCLLNNFNVSKVENMSSMFHNCQGLTTVMVDASKWNATQVTSSTDMFMDCYQIIGNNGTTYDPNQKDKAYAHIDGGDYNPGYLTSGDYKILYTLNEGSLPAGKTNPSSFPAPKNTSVLYLEEPVKEGYTFSGWTGTPTTGLGYSPTLNVSIPVGATGNRIYNAHYTINKYKITLPEHFEFVNTNSNVGVFDFNSTVEFKVTDGYKAVGDVKNGSTVLSPENGIYSIKVPANDVTISGTAKKVISLSVAINDWTYGSTPNTPTVKKDNVEISLNDVSVKYTDKNNQEITPSSTTPAGTYNLTVSYPETATEISASIGTTFTINPYIISATDPKLSITLNPTSFTYDGNKKEPSVTVNYDGVEIPSSEYTVNYKNNINVGTATAEIEDNQGGNYTINGSKDFSITPLVIDPTDPKLSITLNPNTYTYDGTAKEPDVTVSYDGTEIPSSEYTVNYKNNILVGTATAEIEDNDGGNYTVNGSKDFSIIPLEIDLNDPTIASLLSIVLNPDSYIYDGKAKEPEVTITFNGVEIPSAEYTVSYQDNINVGTATAIIADNQGGNYTVNGTAPFTINPLVVDPTDPNLSIVLENDTYKYTGSPIEPKVTITYNGTTIPSSEYTVSYKDNTNVGTATVIITDNPNGNFTISGTTPFTITPGPIYITTANTDTDGAILADASNKNFCSGKAVIEFTAQNGTLDNYSIEFDGDKISAQNGAISGNSIEIALPKDLLPGSYNGFMELTSFDGNSTGKLPIRVVVKLPYYTIVTLYNDVAAVNQLAGEFSAYKWTENGKEISGADSRLLQYRFEKKSVYTAILTKIDGGSYETCPLDLSRVTTSTNTEVNVYPNPGNSLSDVFVEVTNNYQPDADSHIYIYHLNGRLAKEIKTPQEKNTIQLPTGNYSGVYIQNGEKVPFKLIIK